MRRSHRRRRSRGGLGIGVVLVLLGMLFLFARLGIYELGDFWEWWPLVPIVYGVFRAASWHSAEEVGSGVTAIFLGGWFLVATHGWRGLGWSDSWPLALVAVGAGMVVRALLEPVFAPSAPPDVTAGGEPHA
jgi:hypothetical protein